MVKSNTLDWIRTKNVQLSIHTENAMKLIEKYTSLRCVASKSYFSHFTVCSQPINLFLNLVKKQ